MVSKKYVDGIVSNFEERIEDIEERIEDILDYLWKTKQHNKELVSNLDKKIELILHHLDKVIVETPPIPKGLKIEDISF